jgi:hypothetical protein
VAETSKYEEDDTCEIECMEGDILKKLTVGATGLHVQEEPSADTRQHKVEQYRPFAGR